MSRVYIGFLAACLAAAVSVLFSPQAAAQQQPTANEANAAIWVAQAPDEAAFKQMLVKGSPWKVEWKSAKGNTGTHSITFALEKDGATLGGMYLPDIQRTAPGPLKDMVLKKNCIDFILPTSTGQKYNYCLAGENTLKGAYEGFTTKGNRFTGEAVAKPAGR